MAAGQEGGEEDAPNQAATELEEGAATAVAGRRGHQIQLPSPRASSRPPDLASPAVEGHWRREPERSECRAPQLRRYARALVRTRGGAALPENHGEEAEEATK